MELKMFIQQFVTTADLAESELDDIYDDSGKAPKDRKRAVERAFKLGVAEGFSSAECAMAQALNVEVQQLENLKNPALQAVMKMSVQCHRAATEEDSEDACGHSRQSGRRENG